MQKIHHLLITFQQGDHNEQHKLVLIFRHEHKRGGLIGLIRGGRSTWGSGSVGILIPILTTNGYGSAVLSYGSSAILASGHSSPRVA
jgi:hypothetical protein